MTKPVYPSAARRDLADILTYIARDKPHAAVAWVEKIEAKCLLIASQPEMGELKRRLGADVRANVVGRSGCVNEFETTLGKALVQVVVLWASRLYPRDFFRHGAGVQRLFWPPGWPCLRPRRSCRRSGPTVLPWATQLLCGFPLNSNVLLRPAPSSIIKRAPKNASNRRVPNQDIRLKSCVKTTQSRKLGPKLSARSVRYI